MSKKINVSVKMLKNEHFTSIGTPLEEDKKQSMVNDLKAKYQGDIELIETTIHVYTPILTRNGEQCHRFKLLKDLLDLFLKFIFRSFRKK